MGGPDEIQSAGLKMDLQRSEKKDLKEYKIAAWVNDDIAPVNQEVQNRVLKVAKTISDAGGEVNFEARPDFDMLQLWIHINLFFYQQWHRERVMTNIIY